MPNDYDKIIATEVLEDLKKGLETGEFASYNKGNIMDNNENINNDTKEVITDKPGRGKGRPATVSTAVFQKIWNEADSLGCVVDKLSRFTAFAGREKSKIKLYASMRATNMRNSKKHPINLKEFKRGRRKVLKIISE